jgi:hypothetical protein
LKLKKEKKKKKKRMRGVPVKGGEGVANHGAS